MGRLKYKLKLYYRRAASRVSNCFYYVSEKTRWSFYWDAHHIVSNLKENNKISAKITYEGQGYRNQFLHFGNRFAYLNGSYNNIHPSNIITLTWFHGATGTINPELAGMQSTLLSVQDRISRIVVSCDISRNELEKVGVAREKIIKIPLGVDLSLFKPVNKHRKRELRGLLGIPSDSICLGSFVKDGVGWDEGMKPKIEKAPDVFLETVSRLHQQHPNLYVLLTGPARGYVKAGLKAVGIPFLHRYLDNYSDIVPYYQVSDLCLITSRTEGGPKSLLESWATGVPVVSTRVGMCADLIKTNVNGVLVDCDDVAGLIKGVQAIIVDDCMKSALVKNGHTLVSQYSWPEIANQYYDKLYAPLAGLTTQ